MDTMLSNINQCEARAKIIDMLANAIGVIVLSWVCSDDSPLADEILDIRRRELFAPRTLSVAPNH